jgi:2-polyprenyl-3-methyl-5-hydroxy-6-metoxy-1,4-benzoquinol methylase
MPPDRPREACAICGTRGNIWTRNRERELWRCPQCGFAWVPQGVARTATGQSIYETDAPIFATERDYYLDDSAVEAASEKLEWIARLAAPGGTLLDVGANYGHFLAHAQERFRAIGIEPSAAVVAWGREHLGVELQQGSIEVEHAEYLGAFDAITMFDVIEHLPDPRAAIRRCRDYLKPNGKLFITTPDSGAPVARVLGRHWHYVDLLEHISLFSAANLTRLLGECGFHLVERRTFGRTYRLSYIERRLHQLSAESVVLRLAHVASLPMRLAGNVRVPIGLGDVMGLAVART